MQDLAGCTVTQRHFDNWTHLLVTETAPYFVPDDLLPSIAADIPIFPRHSGLQQHLTLPFHDSYTTYRVDPACQHVIFLTDDALRTFRPHIREQILYTQWRYGRSQVYDWELVTEFFPRDTGFEQLNDFSIDTPTGQKCVLGSSLWHSLPAARQEHWLRQFIREKLHPYPTIALALIDLPPVRSLNIASLANTFAFTSGPNCFATTLAAITDIAAFSQTISMLWLHQDVFLNGIIARGYACNHTVDIYNDDVNDAVVIWSDDAGIPHHACWLLGQGIVLNKNAQSWFMPRHLAAIRDVLAYWEDDNLDIQVYTCL